MYRSSLHFLSLAYKTPKNGCVDVNLLNQMNGQQRHSSNGEFSCRSQIQGGILSSYETDKKIQLRQKGLVGKSDKWSWRGAKQGN